jgi:tRNA G10  N-methylase Trm11
VTVASAFENEEGAQRRFGPSSFAPQVARAIARAASAAAGDAVFAKPS